MSPFEPSIPAMLADRAQKQPDDIAYTFIDYEVDPAGYAESLTWAEVHHRARVVADKLAACGSPGDRAVILAPQSLEYVIAFLGAIQAGFVAVPLSVPQFGQHDERVSGALGDSTPAAILTTSAVVDDVRKYARAQPRQRAPRVVEIGALDFDSPISDAALVPISKPAYLQYTSGSTRQPAGVMVTHQNILTNIEQLQPDYFERSGGISPPDMTIVSWLPLYHDMGLVVGLFLGMALGHPAVLMSPVAFMQKPARWMQQLATNSSTFTAAPNFAYELAVRRTSDDDLAGMDLGGVQVMINGAERVHAATVRRFNERFASFNLPDTAVRPSYGLAEATVYIVSSSALRPPTTVRFDYEKLAIGHAERCDDESGSEQVGLGAPRSTTVRVVDSASNIERPSGQVGEVWLHGGHVALGYWRNPELTERTFGGQLVDPSPGTPQGPWLRTGDLGVIFEDELFIVGRIKDLLIVDGRNHYPDDIEATVQQVTGGRVAAISIPDDSSERLVVIAELKKRGGTDDEALLEKLKLAVTSAISMTHSVRVSDLAFVASGSLPITTSGKVRRSACVERYRLDEFSRLDVGT